MGLGYEFKIRFVLILCYVFFLCLRVGNVGILELKIPEDGFWE